MVTGLTPYIITELGTCHVVAPTSCARAPVYQADTTKAEVVFKANLGAKTAGRAFGVGMARNTAVGVGTVGPATVNRRQESGSILEKKRDQDGEEQSCRQREGWILRACCHHHVYARARNAGDSDTIIARELECKRTTRMCAWTRERKNRYVVRRTMNSFHREQLTRHTCKQAPTWCLATLTAEHIRSTWCAYVAQQCDKRLCFRS
jgi:hypothetical protein